MLTDMGENHTEPVHVWRQQIVAPSNGYSKRFVIVGDNIDKRVNPRDMRIDRQAQSLHYFHSYAVRNRVPSSHLDGTHAQCDIKRLPISTFLPTLEDCTAICDNYIVLVSRIIVKHLTCFSAFQASVPSHIVHEFSSEMTQKSEMVIF
jgi:L1 cell adhesion molecule like protein